MSVLVVDLVSFNSIFSLLLNVAHLSGYNVGEALVEDIFFRYNVGCSCAYFCSRSYVLEYRLLDIYAIDLNECDRLSLIVDVLCLDGERYRFAKLERFCLSLMALPNYKVRIDTVICNCQSTCCCGYQVVVRCYVYSAVHDDKSCLIIFTIVIGSYEETGGCCVVDSNCLVVCKAYYCLLTFVCPCPAILGLAVVDQRTVCHFNGQIYLTYSKCSVYRRNACILSTHIIAYCSDSLSHCVGECIVVCSIVRYVSDSFCCGCDGYNILCRKYEDQSAFISCNFGSVIGYGVDIFLMEITVVRPIFCCRGYNDCL